MPSLSDFLDNLYLDANLTAYHWNRDKTKKYDYNEVNPGLGIEHDSGDWRQMIGRYKNSLNGKSNYGLVGYTPLQYDTPIGNLKLGGVAGGVTGYPMASIAPAAGLLATLQRGNLGLNLMAVPTVKFGDTTADGFAGLQARYKIK